MPGITQERFGDAMKKGETELGVGELVLCWVELSPFQEQTLMSFYIIIFHYDVI